MAGGMAARVSKNPYLWLKSWYEDTMPPSYWVKEPTPSSP